MFEVITSSDQEVKPEAVDYYRENLVRRLNTLVEKARGLVPADFMDTLAVEDDDGLDVELSCVKVANPSGAKNAPSLDVLPLLEIRQADSWIAKPGLSVITFVEKLPSGDEKPIGEITIMDQFEPALSLCGVGGVGLEDPGAEIFLKMAESAFAAQPA